MAALLLFFLDFHTILKQLRINQFNALSKDLVYPSRSTLPPGGSTAGWEVNEYVFFFFFGVYTPNQSKAM